jgi:molecular chaperone GrpE
LYTTITMNDEKNKKELASEGEDKKENFEDLTFVESTEDGDEFPTKDVTKKLREELKVCRKEKEEYLTGWQRAKADYINLQKELDSAHVSTSILTKEKVVEKLLPALDSFEMAFANLEHWEKLDKEWQEGIKSIHKQFLTGLLSSGIETIEDSGIAFDPGIHQSISVVETDNKEKDHTVEKVLQVGYKIGDLSADKAGRVIRPAKVTIYEYKL